MSDQAAPFVFEMARRAPSQRTAGLISGMTGYRETARGRFFQREAAGLVVPLIISFGTPFLIALSREPDAADRQPSFAAGLHRRPGLHRVRRRRRMRAGGFHAARRLSVFWRRGRRSHRAHGRHLRRAGRRRPGLARAARRGIRLGEPLRSGRGFCSRSRQPFALTRNRIRLSPAGAQRRWRADRRARARDRLEPQASGEPFSIRTRSRAQADRAHDALPSGLRARTGWRTTAGR